MSVTVENGTRRNSDTTDTTDDVDAEVEFEPVVVLPEVEVSTNEENEQELIKLRAKLFRFDTTDPQHPEWKERGTGDVKLLRHKDNHSVRVVMRRDKTLKICANHFITPWMELKPSCGSNRAWVWTVPADFADELAKSECLAIRFASAEIATQWKDKFEEAKTIIREQCELYKNTSIDDEEQTSSEDDDDDVDDDEKNETKEQIEADDDKVIAKMADLNVVASN